MSAMSRMSFRSNTEIAIHVASLSKAVAFYVGVLGFRLISRTEEQLEIDTGKLRLYVNRDEESTRTYIPSFDVASYEAARKHLEAAGCVTASAGEHSSAVYFQDPFGFVFDIVERK